MGNNVIQAAVLIIGNEVLSGRTQDANLNYLAKGLTAMGIRLTEARVIQDVEHTIIETVNTLKKHYDYVFTTGGIGPTHDDITALAIAKACGVALIRHPEAEALLLNHYSPEDVTEARMKMADIPEGAALIPNPISAAPGFIIENIYVMAGVPVIMQAMFDGIKHTLKGGAVVQSREITSHIAEGRVAEPLGKIQTEYPDVEIGSYPFIHNGHLGTSIVLRSTDNATLDIAFGMVKKLIDESGVEVVTVK